MVLDLKETHQGFWKSCSEMWQMPEGTVVVDRPSHNSSSHPLLATAEDRWQRCQVTKILGLTLMDTADPFASYRIYFFIMLIIYVCYKHGSHKMAATLLPLKPPVPKFQWATLTLLHVNAAESKAPNPSHSYLGHSYHINHPNDISQAGATHDWTYPQ